MFCKLLFLQFIRTSVLKFCTSSRLADSRFASVTASRFNICRAKVFMLFVEITMAISLKSRSVGRSDSWEMISNSEHKYHFGSSNFLLTEQLFSRSIVSKTFFPKIIVHKCIIYILIVRDISSVSCTYSRFRKMWFTQVYFRFCTWRSKVKVPETVHCLLL